MNKHYEASFLSVEATCSHKIFHCFIVSGCNLQNTF
jgi:predicted membrane channel-forming protein YqfA (hemolysin III family)